MDSISYTGGKNNYKFMLVRRSLKYQIGPQIFPHQDIVLEKLLEDARVGGHDCVLECLVGFKKETILGPKHINELFAHAE